MKRLIDSYRDSFRDRGVSNYIGLKIVGLVVLIAVFGFIVVLIANEIVLGVELINNVIY